MGLVTSDRGCGPRRGRHRDGGGLVSAEGPGCRAGGGASGRSSEAPFCTVGLAAVAVLVSRPKDGGVWGCARGDGFTVSERGCICSV